MCRETRTPKMLDFEIDYSRASCLGADQKIRGLWERDCLTCACTKLISALQRTLLTCYLAREKTSPEKSYIFDIKD